MENEHIFYPEFDYPASHLSAFTLCIDVFIVSLKNGEIVRFKPHEIAHFKEWLNHFKVRRDLKVRLLKKKALCGEFISLTHFISRIRVLALCC